MAWMCPPLVEVPNRQWCCPLYHNANAEGDVWEPTAWDEQARIVSELGRLIQVSGVSPFMRMGALIVELNRRSQLTGLHSGSCGAPLESLGVAA